VRIKKTDDEHSLDKDASEDQKTEDDEPVMQDDDDDKKYP
jgi:hypothetical protein